MTSYLHGLILAMSLLHPHHAPKVFRVRVQTSAGTFTVESHRDWSPRGADRFYELVRTGYYDDSRFFRAVPGRWVQFGISGNPAIAQAWRHRTIPDDTLKHSNTRGFIAFSNTGPNTRSTQVYINTGDNSARNDIEPGFAPFGQIVEGMDVVDRIYNGYGEHSGGGMRAGHQDEMFNGGNAYLDREYPKLDKLIHATITPVGRHNHHADQREDHTK
jgi:peptidyl-prolyl cis-trans isomerase A (cyclophilin A)